jgi:hypothetical protein
LLRFVLFTFCFLLKYAVLLRSENNWASILLSFAASESGQVLTLWDTLQDMVVDVKALLKRIYTPKNKDGMFIFALILADKYLLK